MNTNKQLINLAGMLVVVVLLVAGIALVATPLYTQSQTIDGQSRAQAQTNMIYEQQVAQLVAAEASSDQIDMELAELRREIAPSPQLDDLHGLIREAAESVDVHVSSVNVSDPEAWSARGRGSLDGDAAPAPSATEGESENAPAGESEPTADVKAADGSAPPAEESTSPKQQVVATIVIDVGTGFEEDPVDDTDAGAVTDTEDGADQGGGQGTAGENGGAVLASDEILAELAAKAVAFVDALRKGPRLVTPIDLKYEDGELTLTVLTYYRTPAL